MAQPKLFHAAACGFGGLANAVVKQAAGFGVVVFGREGRQLVCIEYAVGGLRVRAAVFGFFQQAVGMGGFLLTNRVGKGFIKRLGLADDAVARRGFGGAEIVIGDGADQ